MNGKVKIVIGLVGEKRAGKETFTSCLLKALDRSFWSPSHAHYTFSEPLIRVLNDLEEIPSREKLQKLAKSLYDNFGEDTVKRGMQNLIEKESAELIIADGMRWPADETFIRGLEHSLIIYVTANQEIRFQRTLKASNAKPGETEMTWEKFLKTEQAPTEVYVSSIGSRADFKVINEEEDSNLNKLHERARIFYEMLLKPLVLKIKEKTSV